MVSADPAHDLAALRWERDLYRRLLELGTKSEIEPFVEEALRLVVDLADARYGLLEVSAADGGNGAQFVLGRDSSEGDLEDFRRVLSQTVIDQTLSTGATVVTTSAHEDPRFSGSGSVRRNKIEAVLCVPIGQPPFGIIYLQGRARPGSFTASDRTRVETFARHLGPFADRLILRAEQARRADHTRPYRALLHCETVVGHSAALAKVLQQLTVVAPHDVSVLLSGPTGTGKTQLARVIHQSGRRASQPFVELNCAALPETLIENELFGAVAGGHSAALEDVRGKVSAADGGTLFLDEVGELALSSQAKLLQFLQSGQYFPLGSTTARHADVRLLAATNVDLEEAVAQGAFREDLLYRLQVIPVRVPPLSERVEDIPDLAAHLCERTCERNELPLLPLSPRTLSALCAEEWPGNVRQLAHAVEAAVLRAVAESASAVDIHHLFPSRSPEDSHEPATFQEAVAQFKEQLVRSTLKETNGNVTAAARRLDIARSYLNNLIKRFGITLDRDG